MAELEKMLVRIGTARDAISRKEEQTSLDYMIDGVLMNCSVMLKEHEELKSRHKILVDECDKMYSTLKEKNKTIEELEDDLATTKDMLNHYLNGNE